MPAPEPILPLDFAIQLYNPDQQIVVKHKPASLTTAATWEFEMPQQSFRTPSHSQLDRSQNDPTISEFTPKLSLKWKKDGRLLSKDLGCYLSGRALNPDGTRNKHKEPDITIAILKDLKEVTMYEPNMARVELEDLKGFEVALLLGAVVIRDVYFGSMKETFNLTGKRKGSTSSSINTSPAVISSQPYGARASASPQLKRIPPTDPRTQWEIDQETERLRKQAAEEERQQRQREETEQRQIRKMLEEEEKEQRRKEAEINAETERLRRMYGQQQQVPTLHIPQPYHRHSHSGPPNQSAYAYQQTSFGPYMSGAAEPQSVLLQPDASQPRLKQKSSFFGFRRHGDQDNSKLAKKKSTMW